MLAFGDSLTAGYGLDQGLGFAPQLQAMLRRHGIAATVVDGGVSGDTSEAGKARLGWTLDGLERKPDLVIVELGANDMLRGLDPGLTEAQSGRDPGGAEAPPNRRAVRRNARRARTSIPAYVARFDAIYPALARRHGVARFIRSSSTASPREKGMQQADGMHPTFAGVKRIVTGITPAVKRTLGRA